MLFEVLKKKFVSPYDEGPLANESKKSKNVPFFIIEKRNPMFSRMIIFFIVYYICRRISDLRR
jgi:hypothetical protein